MLRSTISAFTRVCDVLRCGSGVHDGARSRLCVAPFHAATRPGHEGIAMVDWPDDARSVSLAAVGARNFPIGVFIEWRRPYPALEASADAGANFAGPTGRAGIRPRRTDDPETLLFDMLAVACAGLGWRACQRCRADGQC